MILGIKPDHDGAVALINEGRLAFSIEQEKGSNRRHSALTADRLMKIFSDVSAIPDIVAVGGWHNIHAGYFGATRYYSDESRLFGKRIKYYFSTHERAHIYGAYGMSPFPQRQPCYVLIWEGTLGRFYRVGKNMEIRPYPEVLRHPGLRYSYIYYLGNEALHATGRWEDQNMAGKLMALANPANGKKLSPSDRALSNYILNCQISQTSDERSFLEQLPGDKRRVPVRSSIIDGGVETDNFRNLAFFHSNALFDKFYMFAKKHCKEFLPLLIGGGCGLNCEWNTKWHDSGIFNGVFVPPCPNDAGSAIGSAIDAQYYYTGKSKIGWDVYAGEIFSGERNRVKGWICRELNIQGIARRLAEGDIIAWVNGRCEIGPRALGNRSLLAAPFSDDMRRRLNVIKQREQYRPIAPVCLEEELNLHFKTTIKASPYMLYFQDVLSPALRAITHKDGTARVQTVSRANNATLHELLSAFRQRTGYGVLCNTSLNYPGQGFINNQNELLAFAKKHSINTVVINDKLFLRCRDDKTQVESNGPPRFL